jgi:uncharacterized membrane protein
MYIVAYLMTREKKTSPETGVIATIFTVAANVFTLWIISFEIWSYFDTLRDSVWTGRMVESSPGILKNAQNLAITALWAVYAVAMLVIGIIRRLRVARLTALAFLGIAILKVICYDIWALETIYRVIACVGLGVLLLASAYLYQRYRRAIQGFLTK